MEQQDNIIPLDMARPQRALWNFRYPHQLVRDPAMTLEEKRAILAAWASDLHAVDSLPVLRHLPGTPFPVTFSSVMAAMAELDRLSRDEDDHPPPPRATGVRPAERKAA
jgi:hypothetical protein